MHRLPPNASPQQVESWTAEYEAREARAAKAGLVAGQHFTAHVEAVRSLKRAGKYTEAEQLLVKLTAAAKAEAAILDRPVPPWYDDQLQIVRRKLAARS